MRKKSVMKNSVMKEKSVMKKVLVMKKMSAMQKDFAMKMISSMKKMSAVKMSAMNEILRHFHYTRVIFILPNKHLSAYAMINTIF